MSNLRDEPAIGAECNRLHDGTSYMEDDNRAMTDEQGFCGAPCTDALCREEPAGACPDVKDTYG